MEMLEVVSKLWPIFLSVILGVAWVIRVEVNASNDRKQLEKQTSEFALYKTKATEDLEKIKKENSKEIENLKKEASLRSETTQAKFEDVHNMFMGIKEQLARIEVHVQQGQSRN